MKHIQAKKSLGQNFLKSQKALRAMVTAGEVIADDVVVEIGPGKGALTKVLLETGATVIAFEKPPNHTLIALFEFQFLSLSLSHSLLLPAVLPDAQALSRGPLRLLQRVPQGRVRRPQQAGERAAFPGRQQ